MDKVQFNKAFQKTREDPRYCSLKLDSQLGKAIVTSIEIRNGVSRSQGYKRYFTSNRDEVICRLIRIGQLDINQRDAYCSLVGRYFNNIRLKIRREEEENEEISEILLLEGMLAAEQERNGGMPEGERFDPQD